MLCGTKGVYYLELCGRLVIHPSLLYMLPWRGCVGAGGYLDRSVVVIYEQKQRYFYIWKHLQKFDWADCVVSYRRSSAY